jgi:hypothetical protein
MITSDELHAFIIGAAETLCPWKPRHPMSLEYDSPLKLEYHYYLAGRAAGFITLLLILIALAKLTKEVLL